MTYKIKKEINEKELEVLRFALIHYKLHCQDMQRLFGNEYELWNKNYWKEQEEMTEELWDKFSPPF